MTEAEFETFSKELTAAQPTTVMQDDWEASVNPARLLGKHKGLTCIGCDHPLAKAPVAALKRRIFGEYAAGRPFMRLEACIRKVSDKCNIFCYEWGVKASAAEAKKAAAKLPIAVRVASAKAAETFPSGPREPNTVREYTQPDVPAPVPAPLRRPYGNARSDQVRDMLEGITTNQCKCSCMTTNTSLADSDPYRCSCLCPPQNGEVGETGPQGVRGLDGPAGARGDRGERGPLGLMGTLEPGPHAFEQCACEHEDLSFAKEGGVVSGCSKAGYLLAGFKRTDCNELDCLVTAKCCIPCFKMEGVPPPPATVTWATRFSQAQTVEGEGAGTFTDLWNKAAEERGFCNATLPGGLYEITNRKLCTDQATGDLGVDHSMITRATFKFYPHVNRPWRIRYGGDFDKGAIVLLDGKEVVNRAGIEVHFGGRWHDEGAETALVSPPMNLAANMWHTFEIIGLESFGDGPQTAQVDFGEGWMTVSAGTLDAGCH